MNSRAKAVLIILTLFLSISFSTIPKAPPYFMYHVRGIIECDTLESFSNYTVTLFGGWKENYPDYIQLDWREEDPVDYFGLNVAVTDSNGEFYLRAAYPVLFDSLKVALVQPEGISVFSDAFYVDSLQYTPERKDYWEENNVGCTSCSVQPQSDMVRKTEIIYYNYNFNDVIFSICR